MNFGTVGTSWITSSFIQASQEVNNFTLTAVYSRSEQKVKDFAEKHQAPFVYTDLEEMAKSDKLDCIYIASPNSLHFEQAKLFLQHKKHVICEKPIFSNTKEFQEAFQVAEENGVYLFEAIRNIHTPNFEVLKHAVEKIGPVTSTILHRNRYSSKYKEYLAGGRPNVFTAEFSGGALTDLGIYPLALAVSLFGKPKQVSYVANMLESGVDGSGTLTLEYDNFVSTVMCSKISTSYIPCEIQGENGSILFDDAGSILDMKYIDNSSGQEEPIQTYSLEDNMQYEITNFLQIITSQNNEEYNRLKELSLLTLSITEEARKQNNIIYGSER
ncbi:Gfo/Idh/MocA family protein [Ornithinibacillus halotolerans]|uniref:Oxidoreductase n=1 Tax=Ornithinibacillus halotolerans TaxID=1274357 RepID=A0A916WEP6_9BACI|nr:Gfo/Idh/MocA family oxidoreductase [Ornithinibacillus halotolerans]GGA90975.1 oxidoreductase [Ornithinibacillus halotolerans]